MRRRAILALAATTPFAAAHAQPLTPQPLTPQPWAPQPWAPQRPVRLVVPFAPGGSQDVLGRLLAQAAAEPLGQPVLVDNRAGAGGVLGAEAVAHAAPDGHTLLLATAGQLTIAKAIGRRLSFDPISDFTPILHLADSPVALLAAPSLPAADAAAALRLAREAAQPLPYASTGIGTNTHLIMEDLKARAGLRLEHVPYRGAAAAFNDLQAGRIALMFVSLTSVLAAAAGQFRVLAVTSSQRFPALPLVPTLQEAGVPGFEASIWTGLCGPAGLPGAAVARLASAFRAAMDNALVRTRLEALGAMANGEGGAGFGAMLRADLDRWARVAAPLDIRLD